MKNTKGYLKTMTEKIGPLKIITTKISCEQCSLVRSEYFRVQSYTGYNYYCQNNNKEIKNYPDTPEWCPYMSELQTIEKCFVTKDIELNMKHYFARDISYLKGLKIKYLNHEGLLDHEYDKFFKFKLKKENEIITILDNSIITIAANQIIILPHTIMKKFSFI